MRALAICLLFAACRSDTPEELIENNNVEDLDLFETPGDGDVFDLDVSAEPALVFTGFGLGGGAQSGTWLRYDVRGVKRGEALTDLEIAVIVEMDSVETGNDTLTRHLKTDDFFDVDEHPMAEFRALSLVYQGGDDYRVNGTLTLRGTTGDYSWDTVITEVDGVIQTRANMTFSRWDWGLYPDDAEEAGDDGVGDEVLLDYNLTLRASE
ncbi:MAG: polyisoprenoid-binding protein YceI [Myxococcota bacterium]|jgi:polyisoprenoid-binding protein YceI